MHFNFPLRFIHNQPCAARSSCLTGLINLEASSIARAFQKGLQKSTRIRRKICSPSLMICVWIPVIKASRINSKKYCSLTFTLLAESFKTYDKVVYWLDNQLFSSYQLMPVLKGSASRRCGFKIRPSPLHHE